MLSVRIERIRDDIRQVSESLLPAIPLDREPTPVEQIQIRAFIVIAHSAVEEYVEELLSEALDDALLDTEGGLPLATLSLSVAYAGEIAAQVVNDKTIASNTVTPELVHPKLSALYKMKSIRTNNGIRRHNIEKLCKPLGIDVASFDGELEIAVTALDTLGAKRGGAAHTLRQATNQIIRPEQATEWVNAALDGLDFLTPYLQGEVSRRQRRKTDPTTEDATC